MEYKRALVTGANGFIGSHLVERLNSMGLDIKCLLRNTSDRTWLEGMPYTEICGDLNDMDSLAEAVKDVEIIYHLGGIVRASKTSEYYRINREGTANLLKAVSDNNPELKKFVFVSSQAAWGPCDGGPVSEYGKSKASAEAIVREYPKHCIMRPVAVYGPRDRDFLAIFNNALKGFFLIPAGIKTKLNFVYIKDCIDALVELTDEKEVFISDGNDYSWDMFKSGLESAIGRHIHKIVIPRFIVKFMGFTGTVTGWLLNRPCTLNSDKVSEIFAGDWTVPHRDKTDSLTNLTEGLRITFEWYSSTGWIAPAK